MSIFSKLAGSKGSDPKKLGLVNSKRFKGLEDVLQLVRSPSPAETVQRSLVELTAHPVEEVRSAALGELQILAGKLDDAVEAMVITRLSEMVLTDPVPRRRTDACVQLVEHLRKGSFRRSGGRFPHAVHTLAAAFQGRQVPGLESVLMELKKPDATFYQHLMLSPSADELLRALAGYARDAEVDKGDRNWAVIVLGRFEDHRVMGDLRALSEVEDPYISANARRGIQLVDSRCDEHTFPMDGWEVMRISGARVQTVLASLRNLPPETGPAPFAMMIFAPGDIPLDGTWAAYGMLACPRCDRDVAFELADLWGAAPGRKESRCINQHCVMTLARARVRLDGRERACVQAWVDQPVARDAYPMLSYLKRYP